jgi:hypothetical protein
MVQTRTTSNDSQALGDSPARYPFALACVAAAAAVVAMIDVMLALTPLALFAVAVAASAARGGTRPGLLAAGLAALLSNYLFIAPRYELSFDWHVAWTVALYLGSVPLARLFVVRLRRATHGMPAGDTETAGALPAPGLGLIAPLLLCTCAAVAVVVPLAASAGGYRMPVPAAVIGAGVFLGSVVIWRRRGR